MFRILHDTKYDFIRWWRLGAALTAAFIVAGVVALIIHRGFTYSVDFTGGTVVQVEFTQPPDVGRLRAALEAGGAVEPVVQQFGTPTDYIIRVRGDTAAAGTSEARREISAAVETVAGAGNFTVVRSEAVGARVGAELRRGAIIAILISFAITLVYLAWRFEWRFGLAAVLSSMHDILATVAFIALMRLEVSLTVIAGLLTVIGYSMNDTIIIFDRVRENLRRNSKESLYELVNRSVNETLPRSVLTHATTLAATLALLIFAGEVIRPFAWVMTFGIFVGTFSSIYAASMLLIYIEHRFPREAGAKAKRSVHPVAAGQ